MKIYNKQAFSYISKKLTPFKNIKNDNINISSKLGDIQTKELRKKMLLTFQANDIPFDMDRIPISNLAKIGPNEYRGEALSSPKNRAFLKKLPFKKIYTIIDLRDKYNSKNYPMQCKENNIKYINIPIDSASIFPQDIIKNLPQLFSILNNGHYYIHCAQGLHRTDIALALNYVFNSQALKPPILKGHFRDNQFKFEDISRRLNSIKNALTEEDITKLGWTKELFNDAFVNRKKILIDFNKKYFYNEHNTL